MGIEKSKRTAFDIVFWPGMSKSIDDIVGHCPTCQKRCPSNTKEPMIPHCILYRPWQVVGTDLFTWNRENYLVTVDCYRLFFLAGQSIQHHSNRNDKETEGCIHETWHCRNNHIRQWPQYASAEFESFTKT